jgi:3-isopropylmalate dehydrogenase
MLLAWLGERRGSNALRRASAAIEQALDGMIANPAWRTRDLGGPLGTQAFGARAADLVRELAAAP